jgi:hypothetical protein
MKSYRPFYYLSIAVAVAIAIILIEKPGMWRTEDDSADYFVPDYDSAKVMRIEIEQLLGGAKLKREGKRWLVSGLITPLKEDLLKKEGRKKPAVRWRLADGSRVNGALGVFGGLERGALVSTNPKKRALYQVDDQTGLRVRLQGEGKHNILDVIIGKNGPDFASSYIRRADQDEVYLVPRTLTGRFSPMVDDWRERNLWTVDVDDVTAMEVRSPQGAYSLTRSKDKMSWTLKTINGGQLDNESAMGYVRKLAQVRAVGFADDVDTKSAGLNEPEIAVSITTVDGKRLKFFVGKKDKRGRCYAKMEGAEDIYLLSKNFVNSIPFKLPAPKPKN